MAGDRWWSGLLGSSKNKAAKQTSYQTYGSNTEQPTRAQTPSYQTYGGSTEQPNKPQTSYQTYGGSTEQPNKPQTHYQTYGGSTEQPTPTHTNTSRYAMPQPGRPTPEKPAPSAPQLPSNEPTPLPLAGDDQAIATGMHQHAAQLRAQADDPKTDPAVAAGLRQQADKEDALANVGPSSTRVNENNKNPFDTAPPATPPVTPPHNNDDAAGGPVRPDLPEGTGAPDPTPPPAQTPIPLANDDNATARAMHNQAENIAHSAADPTLDPAIANAMKHEANSMADLSGLGALGADSNVNGN